MVSLWMGVLRVLEDKNFNLRLGEPTNLMDRVPVVIGIQNLRGIFNSLPICIFTHFYSEKYQNFFN